MPYMVTFTINIPQTLAYIPYMDPVGTIVHYGLHIHDTIQQSFVALLGPSRHKISKAFPGPGYPLVMTKSLLKMGF